MKGKKRRIWKSFMAFCLVLCMLFGAMPGGLQLVNPVRTEAADYTNAGCVKWVRARASSLGITLPGTGINKYGLYGANNFWNVLPNYGYSKGSEPAVNALAIWEYSGVPSVRNCGHVAYVESVNGNTVTLTEGGYRGGVYNGNTGVRSVTVDKSKIATLGGCSGFLGYVYLTGGQPTPVPVKSPSLKIANTAGEMGDMINPVTKHYVRDDVCSWRTETNWGMFSWIFNPNRQRITEVGMDLFDANGNLIKHKSETYDVGTNTRQTGYVYYNVNDELGVSLQPGTTYKYQFYAYVGGSLYRSGVAAFTTKGNQTPEQPKLSTSKGDYGVNENIQVNWQRYSNASGFRVRIEGINGTSYNRTMEINNGGATYASFMLNQTGEYKVEVQAYNATKTSAVATLGTTIKVHPNVQVTFVMDKDGEESVLKTQEIMWGQSATPPAAPSKEGHTFQGWNGIYQNVKTDTKVSAVFKRNTYKITFVDDDGSVIKTENVLYGDSATAPEDPAPKKTGYIFGGWNSDDYKEVKLNATIKASYVWGNKNLPVVAKATKCEFDSDANVYKVHVELTNYPDAKTVGRAIVALKTSEGKLLSSTESEVFVLEKDTSGSIDVLVPYAGAASYAEVVVIDKFATKIPYSANSIIAVARDWSDWSTQKPEGNVNVESRTEYRTSDKKYTTSTASSLTGWEKYKSDSAWSAYGAWSGWTTTAYSGSDSRQVETRQESYQVQNGTLFNYSHWCYYNGGKLWYTYSQSYAQARGGWYEERGWGGELYLNKSYNGHWGTSTAPIWFNEVSTPNMETRTRTLYRFRDRSLVTTNYFYKWNEWSDWNTAEVTANDDLKVETRTTYRWQAKMSDVEDKTGTARTISGKVSPEFAGKQATLFVYKHESASDSDNEYVGQTIIGEDGGYSFTYITREEPSQITGDFTIDLAIEGATEPIYLDTIEAPKPVYTVKFIGYDGTVVSTQAVEEGKNAVLPQNPTREGYVFTGWNTGITNIHDDMEIIAEYEKEKYTVVYVDWEKQDISFEQYEAGSDLAAPVESAREGYTFKAWQDEEGNTVTKVDKDLVLTAQYEINKYKVKFYNAKGELISEQTVPYGENAIVPEVDEIENMVFTGWGTSAYVNVTSDVNAYATYAYTETAKTPEAGVQSGSYESSFKVTLTAENNADIYYTMDGSMPDENSSKYTGEIAITSNTVLRYFAKETDKNISEVGSQVYLITANEDMNGALTVKNNKLSLKIEDASPTALSVYCSEADAAIKFYSVDENVATVDEEGNVKGRHAGTTTIFAITEDLKYADSVEVNVTTDIVEVESIEVEQTQLELLAGSKQILAAQVYPQTATYQQVLWFSSDPDVAAVNSDGTIEALKEGEAYVTAYSYTGNCYVSRLVQVAPSGLSLSKKEVNMEIGNTLQLEAYYNAQSISENLKWQSNDTSVATVENGLVSAVNEGTAVITCVNEDGESAAVIVHVYKPGELPNEELAKGDLDGDQTVTLADAQLALKAALKISPLDEAQTKAADVNGDGQVTLADAQIILKVALRLAKMEDYAK